MRKEVKILKSELAPNVFQDITDLDRLGKPSVNITQNRKYQHKTYLHLVLA
jgi:hypothetical protein